ncbi:MAG: ABC transporter substrate-binding protein [Aggregatilineales bacterium]
MRKIGTFFTLSLLIAALASLPVLTQAQSRDNILIVARAADTTGLDPHKQTAFASLRLLELIYETLVTLDQDLNIVPLLAESWQFNADSTQLTMKLREGVFFHDGTSFDSADVKATFTRILDEATGAAARSNYTSIESIETPDAFTVVFNLKVPDVPILAAMASVNAAIVSEEAVAANEFEKKAIGTGPFVLEQWIPEEKTTLRRNDNWWIEGPYPDGIEMRVIPNEATIVAALRAGQVDFALLNDPLAAILLKDDPNIVLNRVPALAYHVFQLNASRPPMDKLEVRQAISCAIDRQEVLETASLGEGTVTGPLTIPAYRLEPSEFFCYQRDLDKARQLLAAAGLPDGFTIKTIVASAEPPTALSEAQVIQAQLAEVGITLEIEAMELSVYVDRWLKGDFDTAVALNGGRPDPYTMYARYWTKSGNLQGVANWIDDLTDELMARGRAESDPAKRFEIFAQFQRHIVEQAPWIWLYNGYEYTAHQKYVDGFIPNPMDSLVSLAGVRLKR